MPNLTDQPKQPSMQDILRLAQSPEGQKIISMIKNSNDPKIKEAMENAAKGDFSQAKQMLSTILSGSEIQKLQEKLGGN